MAINPSNAYVRTLLQSRARGHALGRSAVQRIIAALREDLKRLETTEGTGNAITAERARVLRTQVLGILRALEQRTVSVTRESVRLTVKEIAALHLDVNQRILRAYGKDVDILAGAFDSIDTRVIAAIGSRARNAATFQTLVRRHIEAAAPDLDRLLTASVARGVSVRKLTDDVASVLRGNSPSLQDYGLRKTALGGMRSVTADARMIALSETNNAMREATRHAMAASPIVGAAKWQLSGNHTSSCGCDDLATADVGHGPGYYPMDEWPVAPHPNCACYAGDVKLKPIGEWL